jgi:hypothetical protein
LTRQPAHQPARATLANRRAEARARFGFHVSIGSWIGIRAWFRIWDCFIGLVLCWSNTPLAGRRFRNSTVSNSPPGWVCITKNNATFVGERG